MVSIIIHVSVMSFKSSLKNELIVCLHPSLWTESSSNWVKNMGLNGYYYHSIILKVMEYWTE